MMEELRKFGLINLEIFKSTQKLWDLMKIKRKLSLLRDERWIGIKSLKKDMVDLQAAQVEDKVSTHLKVEGLQKKTMKNLFQLSIMSGHFLIQQKMRIKLRLKLKNLSENRQLNLNKSLNVWTGQNPCFHRLVLIFLQLSGRSRTSKVDDLIIINK